MKVFPVLLAALLLSSLLGCIRSEPAGTPASRSVGPRAPKPFPEVKQFSWGKATIRVGMTKAEVLEQIKVSGLPDWKGKFGINPPSPEMHEQDEWELGYGCGTGAAPGGGGIRITFEGGKVSRIIALPVYA